MKNGKNIFGSKYFFKENWILPGAKFKIFEIWRYEKLSTPNQLKVSVLKRQVLPTLMHFSSKNDTVGLGLPL